MPNHWNRFQRGVAAVIWPSFLLASLATGVFFAKMDPALLLAAFVFQIELSDQAVYSLGFFFFWIVCASACGLTAWLIRTERPRAQFPTLPTDEEP